MIFKGTALVAFIDLLGFSRQIEETWEDSPSALDLVLELKENLKRPFGSQATDTLTGHVRPKPSISTVSDSIVLKFGLTGVDEHELWLAWMLMREQIHSIQMFAADKGFAIRGGMEMGPLAWAEDHDPIGPAFISAYLLESKIARKARVVLGPTLVRELADPKNAGGPLAEQVYVTNDGLVAFRYAAGIEPIMAALQAKAETPDQKSKYEDIVGPGSPGVLGGTAPAEAWEMLADMVGRQLERAKKGEPLADLRIEWGREPGPPVTATPLSASNPPRHTKRNARKAAGRARR